MKRPFLLGQSRPAGLLAVGALLLAGWHASAQAKDCVREQDTVRVSGQVQRQRMTRLQGERDNARALRDTVVTMTLREPLCVMLPDDISLALRPRTIKEVQLLRPERLPAGHDQGVLVDGRLSLASSNAHHLPVLVEVVNIPSNRSSAPPTPAPVSGATTVAAARLTR